MKRDTDFTRDLGEFLCSVMMLAHYPGDPRGRAAADAFARGASSDFAEGGALVPADITTGLWERTYATGEVLRRIFRQPMKGQRVSIPTISETSRADGSRFGGVNLGWVKEMDPLPAGLPKLAQTVLMPNKLAGVTYSTNELMADAGMLGAIMARLFQMETAFVLEDSVFNGSGTGQPLGILKAPGLVTVAKEPEQAAGTVVADNVLKMHTRMWVGSLPNSVWFANQNALPQLMALTVTIGTGGAVLPLFQWAADGTPLLMGRPVVLTEYNATLGSLGDIVFADVSQYVIGEREPSLVPSLHVKFLTDEAAFRFTYRVDGQPLWSSPTTPKNGTDTVSPFVALAAR